MFWAYLNNDYQYDIFCDTHKVGIVYFDAFQGIWMYVRMSSFIVISIYCNSSKLKSTTVTDQ